MLGRIIYFLFLALVLSLGVQAKFPDDPKPCKHGDSSCIVKFTNTLVREKATQGDSDLNLLILDPYPVSKMNIKQGEDSPVNIDLKFNDNKLIGLSTLKIKKTRGFGNDPATKHELLCHAATLSLVGPYSINGKVLILPIGGTGKSNMTLVNADFIVSFMGKPVVRDGQTYMEATNLSINLKTERMWYFFGNLFNGDKALGDNMNAFLNDNWEAIFLEVKASIEKAFAEIFQGIITKVFSKYPYDKYFADE